MGIKSYTEEELKKLKENQKKGIDDGTFDYDEGEPLTQVRTEEDFQKGLNLARQWSPYKEGEMPGYYKKSKPTSLTDVWKGTSAHTPEFQIKYFSEKRGLPASRYRYWKGQIIFQGDDGHWYKEVDGISAKLLEQSWEHLPMLASVGADTYVMAKTGGLGKMLGAGALGGTVGERIRQTAAESFTGETGSLTRALAAGAEQGAWSGLPVIGGKGLEFLVKGYGKLSGKQHLRDVDIMSHLLPKNLKEGSKVFETAQDYADAQARAKKGMGLEYPIYLTPGEATRGQYLLLIEHWLRHQKITASMMNKRDARTIQSMRKNIEYFIDDARKGAKTAIDEVGEDVKKAGKSFIEEQEAFMKTEANNLYELAHAQAKGKKIDVGKTIKFLKEEIKKIKPSLEPDSDRAILKKVLNRFIESSGKRGDLAVTPRYKQRPGFGATAKKASSKKETKYFDDLEQLDIVKAYIDRLLQRPEIAQNLRLATKLGRAKSLLVAAMARQSPGYRNALAFYHRQKKSMEDFKTGLTALIWDMKPGTGERPFVLKLFSGNYSTEKVTKIRDFLKQRNPKLWDGLVGAYLNETWHNATKTLKLGNITYASGSSWVKEVFGTEKKRRLLKLALEPKQYKALETLTEILSLTGPSARGQSATQPLQEITKDMALEHGSTVMRSVHGLLTIINPIRWQAALREAMNNRALKRNLKQISDVFSENKDLLGKIRKAELRRDESARRMYGLILLSKVFGPIVLRDIDKKYNILENKKIIIANLMPENPMEKLLGLTTSVTGYSPVEKSANISGEWKKSPLNPGITR